MCQRGIEKRGLHGYLLHIVGRIAGQVGESALGLVVRAEGAHLAHRIGAAGNHDEYNPHVLGKRHQQVAEVLCLDAGVLLV